MLQSRHELRQRLRRIRDEFMASDAAAAAQTDLAGHLRGVLAELQPERLGLYWPLRSEFNAVVACRGDSALDFIALSLPFARRASREMEYRHWDRSEPRLNDECGIPSADGPVIVPDVVLVPCLGFTRSGFRLGYGGGYFDRWMALHPHATTVGVAWDVSQVGDAELLAQSHDQCLTLIVTERGVI
ncbi:MAG: 5-formyltetrahydrofolate cyclo-ligase [Betaproteobacteria bacterium]|nr:MAG: 5-formyltetrahydrofolate cyclo-ligase [Betaproteobacteria bacterium]